MIDSKAFETGFWSIGVEVDDFEAAIEELKAKECIFMNHMNQHVQLQFVKVNHEQKRDCKVLL